MTAASPTLPKDGAELAAVLSAMRESGDAVASGSSWEITDRWRSFKADFVKAQSESDVIAVKFGDGWTADDARYVAEEVQRVRRLFAGLPSGPVEVPASLGWSADPAAVALPFVEGAPLFSVIVDRSHPMWQEGEDTIVRLARQCGEAIGAYHTAQPAPQDSGSTALAMDDLLSATRRAGVRRSTMLALEPHLVRARGYRFSPNDLMVDGLGRLVMLDPPHLRKHDYLPRDVSAFTFELHKALIGEQPLRSTNPQRRLHAAMRRAFLEGYAATGPSALTSDLETWVLGVFEISRVTGLAYARLKRRAVGTALPVFAWAAQLRRRLGAPPPVPKMGR